MENNYFINAYKYTKTKDSSYLENYSTESFVFVLKYLVKERPETARKILSLFGFEDLTNEDLKALGIETQITFYAPEDFVDNSRVPINQRKARPDITLRTDHNELVFIEVKVDANLNTYTLESGIQIDQVAFYRNIKNCKDVYVLSRHAIDQGGPNTKLIRWYSIYEILKSCDSYIVREFLYFLEENNMGERFKIDGKVLNILDTIKALTSLLRNSWSAAGIKGFKLNSSSFIDEPGFGYYILRNNERSSSSVESEFSYFIGVSRVSEKKEEYSNKITLWARFDAVSEKDRDYFDKFDCGYIAKRSIDLCELIKLDSIDEQERVITDWIVQEVKPLLK